MGFHVRTLYFVARIRRIRVVRGFLKFEASCFIFYPFQTVYLMIAVKLRWGDR